MVKLIILILALLTVFTQAYKIHRYKQNWKQREHRRFIKLQMKIFTSMRNARFNNLLS